MRAFRAREGSRRHTRDARRTPRAGLMTDHSIFSARALRLTPRPVTAVWQPLRSRTGQAGVGAESSPRCWLRWRRRLAPSSAPDGHLESQLHASPAPTLEPGRAVQAAHPLRDPGQSEVIATLGKLLTNQKPCRHFGWVRLALRRLGQPKDAHGRRLSDRLISSASGPSSTDSPRRRACALCMKSRVRSWTSSPKISTGMDTGMGASPGSV